MIYCLSITENHNTHRTKCRRPKRSLRNLTYGMHPLPSLQAWFTLTTFKSIILYIPLTTYKIMPLYRDQSNKRLSNENRHTFFRFLRNSKYDKKKQHIFHTAYTCALLLMWLVLSPSQNIHYKLHTWMLTPMKFRSSELNIFQGLAKWFNFFKEADK